MSRNATTSGESKTVNAGCDPDTIEQKRQPVMPLTVAAASLVTMKQDHRRLGFDTLAIHAGQEPDPRTGAVVPPIFQTSTYAQDAVGEPRLGYEYSRTANPTRDALQECLAALEGGRRGLAFASGMAAEDTLVRTVCRPGDHVVIPDDAYGGTYRLFARVAPRSPTTREPCWSWTTRSPRRTSSSRWRSVPTWWCTPRPSTSAGTPTLSGARSLPATRRSPQTSRTTKTPWARPADPSTPGSPCAASRPWGYAWSGTATTPSGSWST